MRKKLVGKDVAFVIEYTVPGTGREYGCVYLGKGERERMGHGQSFSARQREREEREREWDIWAIL